MILLKEPEFHWLDDGLTTNEVMEFLHPYPENEMAAYTISKRVTSNTLKRNVPEILEPFNYPELSLD